jgi:hypothetical protein
MNANNITFFIVIIFTLKFRLLLFKVYVQLIQTYKISYLPITVCIRIVADFESQNFQDTTKFYTGHNARIYYYFGYYFYTLLGLVIF